MKLRPDFLIIGMERSGTLWVSATLNEHPEIASFPNLPFKISADEIRTGEVHLDFIDSFYPGIKKICSIRDPEDRVTHLIHWGRHQFETAGRPTYHD